MRIHFIRNRENLKMIESDRTQVITDTGRRRDISQIFFSYLISGKKYFFKAFTFLLSKYKINTGLSFWHKTGDI
jgi:hypothetical protein